MSEPDTNGAAGRPLRLMAILLAAGAIALAAWTVRERFAPPAAPPARVSGAEPGEHDVRRALELAGIDTACADGIAGDVRGSDPDTAAAAPAIRAPRAKAAPGR